MKSAIRRNSRKRGMNVSGKLIIQGKAWGEFENAKRSKGNIEISGYRSYGGTHTVRMVDQPQLNDNQQIVLDYLKKQFGKHSIFVKSIFDPISDLLSDIWIDDVDIAFEQLDLKQEIQVLEAFAQWALEQEEE